MALNKSKNKYTMHVAVVVDRKCNIIANTSDEH